jgi:hypothetical protein
MEMKEEVATVALALIGSIKYHSHLLLITELNQNHAKAEVARGFVHHTSNQTTADNHMILQTIT